MNYIRHLNHVLESFSEDKHILPRHISMYMALFFLWNRFQFPKVIYFNRSELMPLSKIGSMKYYHLTLNELDQWNYLHYQPSKSAYKSSCVTMTCFNSDTCSGTSSDRSTGTCSGTSTGTSASASTETSTEPSGEAININTNKTLLNNLNSKETITNYSEQAQAAHPAIHPSESSDQKNESSKRSERFQKPALQELESYFQSKGVPGTEAERFFNHFESKGWKVGAKSPMKDWKAAVRNWILNMKKFRSDKIENANPLATDNDKDYGEAL
ncbi:MAG: hypothetical protein N4A74_15905 [Carboxylicivirga sp.]|jgi:hypothetical protein|nr:hypothetical protein [Carboxylicivirga sp.]